MYNFRVIIWKGIIVRHLFVVNLIRKVVKYVLWMN